MIFIQFPACLPLILLSALGFHCGIIVVNLLSFIQATCPAHLHLACVLRLMVSVICVLCLMTTFSILPIPLMPNITFSILRCATLSFPLNILPRYLYLFNQCRTFESAFEHRYEELRRHGLNLSIYIINDILNVFSFTDNVVIHVCDSLLWRKFAWQFLLKLYFHMIKNISLTTSQS